MNHLIYPDHPILKDAWTYKLIDFRHHGFSFTPDDHFIDMTLSKDDELITLRFENPSGLTIKECFPAQHGIQICDVTSDGLDQLRVKVSDFENGSIEFYARSVVNKATEQGAAANP